MSQDELAVMDGGKCILQLRGVRPVSYTHLDPQGSLTISLGNPQPDKLPFTLSDAMGLSLIHI